MKKKYYIDLIGRIYKILPLFEENKENFYAYVDSLYIEMCGNKDFSEIQQVKYKLNGITVEDVPHKSVRRTVFECISIVERIITMMDANI